MNLQDKLSVIETKSALKVKIRCLLKGLLKIVFFFFFFQSCSLEMKRRISSLANKLNSSVFLKLQFVSSVKKFPLEIFHLDFLTSLMHHFEEALVS